MAGFWLSGRAGICDASRDWQGRTSRVAIFLEDEDLYVQIIASFRGHRDSVEAVGFCATLPYCATGSMDNYLIIWDVNTKQQRFKLKHDVWLRSRQLRGIRDYGVLILFF